MAIHSGILAWRIPGMDRGTWQATVHGVTKSQTHLSNFHFLRDLKAVKCSRLWNWGKGYVEVFCTILATFL